MSLSSKSRRLRVVYLDHCAQLSGAELALLRMLPALADDVEAHVILGEDGPLVTKLEAAGVSTEILPMNELARGLGRDRVHPARLPLGGAAQAVRYAAVVARRLRQLRPDLVHTNSLKAGVYGSVASTFARVPAVWHVRECLVEDYLPAPAIRLVRALVRHLPAMVIANSRSTLRAVDSPGLVSAVIPSPVLLGAVPCRRPPGGPLRVGMVGRLTPSKGQHLFLSAFAQAFPQGDSEAVLVGAALFGEARYEEQLRAQVAALGLQDRVEMTGFREDIGAELGRLDVLVHASLITEGFGLVVVEGMAAGLAVVAASAGGPAEIITHDQDGLLYPARDGDAIASALRRLAADEPLRRRLGEAARRRAQDFTPQIVARQVMDVYRSVLCS